MRKNKDYIKNVKRIFFGSMATTIFMCGSVFAADNLDLDINDITLKTTSSYEEWKNLSEDEKENSLFPQTLSVDGTSYILDSNQEKNVPSVLSSLLGKTSPELNRVKALASQSKYNLADDLNIRVEHQGTTGECWNFSTIKSLETNEALRSNSKELNDYSERHMDYATSKTFTDGINPIGYDRELGSGGVYVMAFSYLVNGTGAINETKMPFENNENKIELSSINKSVDKIVTDYNVLPSIYKTVTRDANGNTNSIVYKDTDGNILTNEEVSNYRNLVKEKIVKNGGLAAMTAGNYIDAYSYTNSIFDATNYNLNVEGVVRDHAITIVGWDDNYSKNNFKDGVRPLNDGAYIALNSYGEENFVDGYYYISYEDLLIDNELYSVENTSKVDYAKIYQNDFYGGVYQIGSSVTDTGYYGTVFERTSSESETINYVGIQSTEYANFDIYINPNSSSIAFNDLIKVASTDEVYSPGYHRIAITPTEITSGEFAIVVKEKTTSGKVFFPIESEVENTIMANVTSSGKSFISLNGTTWSNLSELNLEGIDMDSADVCIKAFVDLKDDENKEEPDTEKPDTEKPSTEEPDTEKPNTEKPDTEKPDVNEKITSSKYNITDNMIKNVEHDTKLEDFKKKFTTDLVITVKNEEGNELESGTIIKTGMKLVLSDASEYDIIVRGDINKDGKVTITDLSKLILQYNGNVGYELTGPMYYAGDLSLDGQITITDISQMIVLYNSL